MNYELYPKNIKSYSIKGISMKTEEGVGISYDNQLLLENIGRIIMTFKTERVNNPTFGSILETFLFNRGSILKQHAELELTNEIELYEPRVKVIGANVSYNKDTAVIAITVQRKDTLEKLNFEEMITIE